MGRIMNAEEQLNLPPGFRFFPTDEELVVHYLCRKAASQPLAVPIIAEVDLYKFDPWHLPEKALFGEKEWYFFTPRDRKYPNGSRPNRAAGSGYWKATGADKPITAKNSGKRVGIKKALVFYVGKAPKGTKTNWIMHEYRLAEVNRSAKKKGSLRLDDWVLCRIYNKKSSVDKLAKEQQKEWSVHTTTVDEIDDVDTEMLHSHSGNINFEHSQDSTKCAPSPDCTTTSVQDSKVSAVTNPMNPYFQNQKLNNGYPMEHTELAPLFSSMLNSRSTYDRSDLVAPPLLMTDSSCSMHSSPDIKTEKEEVQSNLKLAELMQQQDNNNNNNNSNMSQSLFNFGFESPFPQLDQLQSQDPLQDFLASLSAPTYMQRPY